jgi:V-type H+-transporting ATPase subunit C
MFWLLALPLKGPVPAGGRGSNRTWELLQEKTSYGVQLSSNYKLDVPDLRVGTLDTLLALSDDLVKVATGVEAVVTKIRRTVADAGAGGAAAVATLKVENLPVEAYLTRFKWDEPKFPLRRPLRETVEKIGEMLGHIEDDLKARTRRARRARRVLLLLPCCSLLPALPFIACCSLLPARR